MNNATNNREHTMNTDECQHPHIHEVGSELWCPDCGAVYARDTSPLAGYVKTNRTAPAR